MNLIANTGIHFLSIPLELNLNDPFKISFREWFDMVEEKLKLELVHHFADEDVWVLKSDLKRLGYVQSKDEMIDGKLVKAGTVNGKWKEVSERDEFVSGQYKKIIPSQNDAGESDCFHLNINRLRIDKFENCWLPFPFFVLGANKRSQFGPTNWCRIKLVPIEETRTAKKYNLVLAFDTRAKYEADNFEDQDLKETPVFSSEYEDSKDFAVCNNEMMFFDFCSSQKNCGWVDDYLLQLYHGVDKLDAIRIKRPKLNYLANYIFLIKSIQRTGAIPTITLFSDKDAEAIDVDIVIDICNPS